MDPHGLVEHVSYVDRNGGGEEGRTPPCVLPEVMEGDDPSKFCNTT